MKRINTIIIIALLGLPGILQAQNEMDALRYSQFFYGSTARSMSMGGAFTALGGDFSTLGLNPGGIGVYRAGEFSITPVFNFHQGNANFMGTSTDEFKYSFGIDNLGLVGVLKTGRETGWISTNFGVGFNRYNNYNNKIIMQGDNPYSSMADYFIYYANIDGFDENGINPERLNPLWEKLAYDAYVIDIFEDAEGFYYSTLLPIGTMHNQSRNYSGSMNEWTFNIGGNYDNKLYFGASLGLISVNYSDRFNHTETSEDISTDFLKFSLTRRLITKGNGYNFKIGVIYKPLEALRFGASLHLPTFYKFEDEESNRIEAWYWVPNADGLPANISASSNISIKEYSLTTPLRANLGGAILFGKLGLISMDYEFIDYTTMRLNERPGDDPFEEVNNNIRFVFKKTHNIRLGGELRFNNVSFRGGYALYMSPFDNSHLNSNANYSILSTGIGLREGNYFLDFGYSLSIYNEKEDLYYFPNMETNFPGTKPSENKYNNSAFKITFGFRF